MNRFSLIGLLLLLLAECGGPPEGAGIPDCTDAEGGQTSCAQLAALRPQLVVQVGHADRVRAVAYASDGSYVLTGSMEGDVILWQTHSGLRIRALHGHQLSINAVALSPDGMHALTGSNDGTVVLWEVASGDSLHVFHKLSPEAVAFSPDGASLVIGNADGLTMLRDTDTGDLIRTFQGDAGRVNATAFSPDGAYLATGHSEAIAILWEVETGSQVQVFRGHDEAMRSVTPGIIDYVGEVTAVTFSPDGRSVLTGSVDRTMRLWDVTTGETTQVFQGLRGAASTVAFSPSGAQILTGGFGEGARLWDVATGQPTHVFRGRAATVAAFSPDGAFVLTGNEEASATLWDAATQNPVHDFRGEAAAISHIAFSPDGQLVLTGSEDKRVVLWDVGSGSQVETIPYPASIAVFSPDGKQVIAGGDEAAVLMNVSSWTDPVRFEGHTQPITDVAFSPDGTQIATGSSDETVRLWTTTTGEEGRRIQMPPFYTASVVAWSPDSIHIVTGHNAAQSFLWDATTGDSLRAFPESLGDTVSVCTGGCALELTNSAGSVVDLAFSADGRYVLAGHVEAAILWDVARGDSLQAFAHPGGITSVAFLQGDTQVLTGGWDKTARLWDVASGEQVQVFWGGVVQTVAASPDGRYVLTGNTDGTARLWDALTGREVARLLSYEEDAWVVVAPDGRFDTNDLEKVQGLHWIMPDDPMTPLPIELFMQTYYEPRLLTRLMAGEVLPPIRDLAELNRMQPSVAITNILPDADDSTRVSVTVDVVNTEGDEGARSNPRDLYLFRDGLLVGLREGSLQARSDISTHTFEGIRLPLNGTSEVSFSAYAFNEDQVKSATARQTYAVPDSLLVRRGRAYLVSIGVNRYENPHFNLSFAVNDGRAMQQSLSARLNSRGSYEAVVPVALYSDSQQNLATKAHFQAVIDLLAGRDVDPSIKQEIPNADQIAQARPEDLILFTFSGHGYTGDGDLGERGAFYFLTSDIGQHAEVNEALLRRTVSSNELTRWLRAVDAGDMALVIDACHSAAIVEEDGFKPGPMGSRGLGQLAYNKGILILAASQANDVALESNRLQQGLLSYALVQDGLEDRQADFAASDGLISLSEWLAYGVERVPQLHEELLTGKGRASSGSRAVTLVDARGITLVDAAQRKVVTQQPSLFDFRRRDHKVVLWGAAGGNQ